MRFSFWLFFVLRRFSSWWQHFLLSAKAHYNFVPNKEGSRRRDSLVFPYCCMLAIFWVQSWWLGNTPENQDEPSRKNGHIFDTFSSKTHFLFLYQHEFGEGDKIAKVVTKKSHRDQLFQKLYFFLSEIHFPVMKRNIFNRSKYRKTVSWRFVEKKSSLILILLNFSFSWWKGTKIAKKIRKIHLITVQFFLMLPFNFWKGSL